MYSNNHNILFRVMFVSCALIVFTACSRQPEVVLPEGTKVSGKLANGDVLNVVYWPSKEEEEPHVMPVRDDHVSFTYVSAVPPGEYVVYAYITGARSKIAEVTVGENPVVLDIPEDLKWEEVRDQISGM
ncbi:hypothetical protein [Gimesia aquarii]|uniref:Uncharacterized protein n=1 Tax=Gimesia aquarii TaxID=2527964 RepID=A0A517WSR7_9PLAN|nr:hypothetical protein [Gimesia aquarii]QDU08268.1 hypothetical protein V202x_16340 [Gimesia aquarii]